MIVQSIKTGALVLAKRSGVKDTCVILEHYSGIVDCHGVLYYYAWSISQQSFVVIYSTDIIGVIDEQFGLEIELSYPDFESDIGYAANGFRWRAVSGINPNDVHSNGIIDICGPFDTEDDEE